ncbi:MAG: histidine--tRNA ligase [Lachnospiraceae bacterium]|nr:histidine--tRNA ligase [Lachnospiraceae bacterium]
MALKKKPVTGMKDILPDEMAVRDYVIHLVKETYASYGFSSMDTPCMEHIENLCSKQGGDNEKLIFKVLKRGEKLNIGTATKEDEVVDCGMRYDLTLPLARYYANHANVLPAPFKAMQIGNVWRADRPQKGRFRQFMQCDIDVLGESSYVAEIELILATANMIGQLGFCDFTVVINDRRFLKAMAAYSGFQEKDFDDVFIILDKMDKIGAQKVGLELEALGYGKDVVVKYLTLFQEITHDLAGVKMCKEKLGDYLSEAAVTSMETIISCVESAKECAFQIQFQPTMVRGQSYYTGTIFEININGFPGSVAGGGRYDEMIGKFTGQNTPAVGFSIGFERIIMLLLEKGFQIPGRKEKLVYLLEKDLPTVELLQVFQLAKAERQAGKDVLIVPMKKNKKFQKEQLLAAGYKSIVDVYQK